MPIDYFSAAYIADLTVNSLTADKITTGTLSADVAISIGTATPIILQSGGTRTISALSYTSTTATFTTSVAHNYVVGDLITISGMTPAGYNGNYTVTATNYPTNTTFTISNSTNAAATVLGTALGVTTRISISAAGYRPNYNDVNTPFYIDSKGKFSLGTGLKWDGTTLTVNGGGTFSGALSAATGTFAGSLSAAGGTFAGLVSVGTQATGITQTGANAFTIATGQPVPAGTYSGFAIVAPNAGTTTTNFWGVNSTNTVFQVGTSTNFVRFDNSSNALTVQGAINAISGGIGSTNIWYIGNNSADNIGSIQSYNTTTYTPPSWNSGIRLTPTNIDIYAGGYGVSNSYTLLRLNSDGLKIYAPTGTASGAQFSTTNLATQIPLYGDIILRSVNKMTGILTAGKVVISPDNIDIGSASDQGTLAIWNGTNYKLAFDVNEIQASTLSGGTWAGSSLTINTYGGNITLGTASGTNQTVVSIPYQLQTSSPATTYQGYAMSVGGSIGADVNIVASGDFVANGSVSQFRGKTGSASAPSFAYGTTSTGMYFNSTPTIRFAVAGGDQLAMSSTNLSVLNNMTVTGTVTMSTGYSIIPASDQTGGVGSSSAYFLSGFLYNVYGQIVRPKAQTGSQLGTSGVPYQDAYFVNRATISDINVKNSITPSDLGLSFINKISPVKYKYNIGGGDEEILEDGSFSIMERPGVRWHYGFIAQDIKKIIKELNIDAAIYGMADKNDENSLHHIKPDEFLAPMVKAIQELSAKNDELEARLAALENK